MAIAAFTIFSAYLGFIIAWYIFQLIACWSVFSKAGEAGWKSLIPVYNSYVLFRISWETRFFWYGVLLSVGGVMLSSLGGLFGVLGWLLLVGNMLLQLMNSYRLSLAFGHGVGFALGLVFLNPIFMLILGLGKSQYYGPQ